MTKKSLAPVNEQSTNQLAELQSTYEHGRDLANRVLARVQTSMLFSDFSTTVGILELKNLKESKGYKDLAGAKLPDGRQFDGTWADFCEKGLGQSKSTVDENIANVQAFGERALESMSQMGIGYREMRQYRKLPSDQQEALIEVAKTNDKESFVELAEEIIAKNAKEKEALKQEAESKAADYEAINEVLEKKSASLAKAEQELAKAKQVLKKQTPDEVLTRLKTEVAAEFIKVSSAIGSELRSALQQISAHSEANGQDINLWLYDHVRGLEAQLSELGLEFAIQPDFTEFEEA